MIDLKKFGGQFGVKRWEVSVNVPIELFEDERYIEHLKNQLKERCVREYIENVEDSFVYRKITNRLDKTFTLSVTLEDLFELKEENKRLRRDITELMDQLNYYLKR